MFTSFIDALPEKVRSAEWKDEGTKFRKKEKALGYRYVELNQLYKKFIALDIDDEGAAHRWDERGLPPPTYIVVNPANTHCHYLYELKTPVYYTEEARRAPQRFYEATDIALTRQLGADTGFVGHLVKNPLHPSWRTICHKTSYDLEDFQEYGLELQDQKRKLTVRDSGLGRNVTLFDTLRFWAYAEVKSHCSFEVFQQALDVKAQSINQHFTAHENGVLPVKEVLSTAKSIGKWTWKHRHSIGQAKNKGILDLPADMPIKEKQSLGAEYSHIARTEKVDDKIKAAVHRCIQLKLNPTIGNLEKFGLSRSTLSKYKDDVRNWTRILTA